MAKVRIQNKTFYAEEVRECYSFVNLLSSVTECKSGWSQSGDTTVKPPYGSGYTLKANPTASANEFCIATSITFPLINDHIYYRTIWAKQDTQQGSVGTYWPIAEPSFTDGQPCGAAGVWNRYSAVRDRASFSNGNYPFRLDYNNNKVAGVTWFACPMLIDLTASFGKGKEPTVEWCDANLPYFVKSYEIPIAKTSIGAGYVYTPLLRTATNTVLKNLITNGSFESTTGWNGLVRDASDKLYGSYSSKLATTTGTVINTRSMIKPIIGHKYYGRHSIKTDGDPAPADCRFEWFAGDGAGLNFVFGWNNGNHPTWYTESNIINVTAVNGTSYVCRNFAVAPKANIWSDGLMIVDLTEAFGAGKEPTKEWMDANIPFFEGSYSVPITNFSIGADRIECTAFYEQVIT